MCKKTNKRCVGYCRISSESQIDNTSIENQIDKIKLYCELHDIELVKIFKDEAQSGSTIDDTKRTGYNDMIKYIEDSSNNIDILVVNKVDRIHRSGKNLLCMVEDILDPINVAFVSITENFDTSTAQGKLFLTMLGGFAEFERNVINERTKSGRISKAKNKQYAGGRIPFGFNLKDSDNLSVNDKESDIVKRIYQLRKDRVSLNKIVKLLNEEGQTINNKKFSNSKVDYLLKNKIYIGIYTYDGKKENNSINFKVPRVISTQLFNKVQEYNFKQSSVYKK